MKLRLLRFALSAATFAVGLTAVSFSQRAEVSKSRLRIDVPKVKSESVIVVHPLRGVPKLEPPIVCKRGLGMFAFDAGMTRRARQNKQFSAINSRKPYKYVVLGDQK